MKQPTPKALVCYHGKCPDGFGAAFAAWLKLGDTAEYVGCQYTDKPGVLDFTNRDVYVLDFSFSRDIMTHIGQVANSLTMLDHHATAQTKLAGFKPLCCGKVHFDLDRSGAVLAWKHFHPDTAVPFLFECIEDRDLWRFHLTDSRSYLAWLDSLPQDFATWKQALEATSTERAEQIVKGWAMAHKFQVLCESISQAKTPVRIAGVDGLAVNASVEFVSEVGELLAQQSGTFGLVWRVLPDKQVKCSLRSVEPFNVRAIAEQFGGGGHAQAASFVLPLDRLLDVVHGDVNPA